MESGIRAERSLKGKKAAPRCSAPGLPGRPYSFPVRGLHGSSPGADKSEKDEDEIIYNDFTLGIGDRIDISNYRVELIEIQSVKDGIAVLQVSKIGGGLDEQRAFLENRANNFIGAEMGHYPYSGRHILDESSARVRIEHRKAWEPQPAGLRSADIRRRQACPPSRRALTGMN